MKRFIPIFIFINVLGLLALVFIPDVIDKYQSRSAAEGVLENVINQNYNEAFDHVYFFDRASDLEPEISFENAKKEWTDRLTGLRERGIYLVDYKRLRIYLDDQYPEGKVDLVFMENGEKKVKKDVGLWFASREDKWKLGDFYYHQNTVKEEWEDALSGNFN
ncbi:hypothetical protein [Bacillus sp. Marseille-Q1617]|uniref:hypothetical protein n=1 Tax=Bacillus sp. Marseille-Q1617 TaxID=2736887 RepID=UPI001589EADA|nr:hypothetical protein [Bacillus sp. Marseille-Q1617]